MRIYQAGQMWVFSATAIATLVRPHECGNLTQAWAHYFPYDSHNIQINCRYILPEAQPQQSSIDSTVLLQCHNDGECSDMMQTMFFGRSDNTLGHVVDAATALGTNAVACNNVTDCPLNAKFDCIRNSAAVGYCTPLLESKDVTWKTPCFSGAHSTCTELVINLIGFGVGIILGISQLFFS